MANIKSIGGNPIVVGMDGLTDDAKATLMNNRPAATLDGTLVTADDAAHATPIALSVYGQSTQDGTPTPSSPVPIVSVEGDSEGNISLVAQLTSDASVTTTTPIDLDGHELRSLPDGTRDELTVDAEGHVTLVQRVGAIDLGGRTWNAYSSGQGKTYYANVAGTVPEKAAGASNVMCASYALGTAGTSLDDGQMIGGANNNRVYIRDDRYTTEADFKTGMSGVTLNYALATPVTHDLGTVSLVPLVGPDLTAQTVPTAPLALTYERDATIVLDRLTAMWGNVAPVEGDTSSANYAQGSYMMHDGQLCKVTTAIATGETITIGTNVTATTVMAEVIALTQ